MVAARSDEAQLAVPAYTFRRITRLEQRLTRRFALADTAITLPRTGISYRIARPAAFDPLLLAAANDPEDHLPYWTLVWPSGIALADRVLMECEQFVGQRVLELGCGLGITATAAVAAGASVVVTDYAATALLICQLNALRNTGRTPITLQLNWRRPPFALWSWAQTPFAHVLAADVLYEERDVEPLLHLVERLLAPEGMLWLAEPGRPVARHFIEAALQRGWHDEVRQQAGPWYAPLDAGVIVHVHCLRRSR
ncbi:MAG: methyltransferase domain-containing protein [Herpetosiphonaceae bacterium]|nr:methyltransferase domain-containing protein [Herpetosiphonaceae bacterium]